MTASRGRSLRVATWNLLYRDLDARLPAIVEVLKSVDPHVICTQEVTASAHARLAASLGMAEGCFAESGLDGLAGPPVGNGICTRPPIRRASRIARDADGPEKGFPALLAETALGSCWFISAHLRHTPAAGLAAAFPPYPMDPEENSVVIRMAEIGAISDGAACLPAEDHVVLCGDLNLLPDSEEYYQLLARGWVDSWRQRPRLGSPATIVDDNPLLPNHELEGYRAAFDNLPKRVGGFDYTLDFQFLRSQTLHAAHAWTIGRIGDTYASDHLGIVVDYVPL